MPHTIMVDPLEGQSADEPQFSITVSRKDGLPGVGSQKEYQSLEDTLNALQKLAPHSDTALATAKANLSALVSLKVLNVELTAKDFDRSGMPRPI